jgi:hypothetical protein
MQVPVTPSGKMVPPNSAKALLEAIIRPGDRVCLEGATSRPIFLRRSWQASTSRGLQSPYVQSGIVLQAHLDLFEQGIAPEQRNEGVIPRGTESLRTLRWRELYSNHPSLARPSCRFR